MKTVAVYCRGVNCSSASIQETSVGRVEIGLELPDPGDGLYRALLVCERGEISLGVLQPKDGKLVLVRRPEKNELARLGEIRCIRVGCSFPFGKKTVWHKTTEPSGLVKDAVLKEKLERQKTAYWRRDGDILLMAFPLKADEPFPLETMFCFASAEWVEGERCAVYRFDAADRPQMPESRNGDKKR